ncbi:hypothetical protein RDI58_024284 [Solanum bulbocastanum]|uniref:Uncharacterized protein n=1 Tax=Solanum bulbocastanum TaxID=147425 RepID=A0AAN8Y3G2_SOLBU
MSLGGRIYKQKSLIGKIVSDTQSANVSNTCTPTTNTENFGEKDGDRDSNCTRSEEDARKIEVQELTSENWNRLCDMWCDPKHNK